MESAMYEKDQDLIETILELIDGAGLPGPSQSNIVKHCNDTMGTNRKKVLRVLEVWDGKHWVYRTGASNAKQYQRWNKGAV